MKKQQPFPKYFLLIILLPLILRCTSSGKIYIEKDKSFVSNKKQKIEKIVSITPTFYVIKAKAKKNNYKTLQKGLNKVDDFEKALKQNAKKNHLDLQVISSNNLNSNDLDYFNILKPLRDQIILSNIYQTAEISKKGIKNNGFKVPTNYFTKLPQICPDYNYLVEKYKTKYFAVNAVFAVEGRLSAFNILSLFVMPPLAFNTNASTYYYTIIVDVEKSEIVYREIRYIDEKSFTTNLNSILYDSFNIIKSKK